MSRKTELQADLKRIGYQFGGAHLTRQARDATFNTFAKTMRDLGYGIHAASQIGGRHLQAYVQQRTSQGVSTRTLANEVIHLRAVLVQINKQGLARNSAYSNQALGIGRGSRVGTKLPLSDASIQAFREQRHLWIWVTAMIAGATSRALCTRRLRSLGDVVWP